MDKAQIQHLVGLIEHQMARLAQIDRAAIHQIDQAAGCGHQNIGATRKGGDLAPDRLTADDGGDLDLGVERKDPQAVGDLVGQFTRGCKDQRARRPRLGTGVFIHQMRNQRQAKGQRLACAGLGKAQDVMTIQRQRNRLILNGGWGVKARRLERLEQRGLQPEHVEIEQIISFRAPHHAAAIDQGPHTDVHGGRGCDRAAYRRDRQTPA